MYPTNTMKIVGAVSFSMMGQRRRRWPNIETALAESICVSVCLALAKKGYPPLTACRAFSHRQRMEVEYYT